MGIVWVLCSKPQFEVKLTDLEYTKIIDRSGSDRARVTTSCVGTQGWQAPEVQSGLSNEKSSDIFSLGLVYFYVLSGGQHALGRDRQQRSRRMDLLKHEMSTAPLRDSLRGLCQRAGPEAADVVNAMLQPEMRRRPTIAEVWARTNR